MVKIDLVTGFLGSGKTTFIRNYASYCMEQGERIGILENDFGAVNIDMMLLQDMLGNQCDMEMVAGGCGADCYRRRLKTKLIAMGMSGYDRVIVEPSGIFDVDDLFDVLHEEPLDKWYQLGSVITIVDAKQEQDLPKEAGYLLASQVASAGAIVMSKTGQSTKEQQEQTIQYLNELLREYKSKRVIKGIEAGQEKQGVLCTSWEKFSPKEYEWIQRAGYLSSDCEKLWFSKQELFESVYLMNYVMSTEQLREKVEKLFSYDTYGTVFRVKGFMPADSGWLQLNATKKGMELKPIQTGQEVIIVIGNGLKEKEIQSMFAERA